MTTTGRPIRARIDLSALRHNFSVARRHARASRVWSVIKANAYGHGALNVAQALAGYTDGFALIELEMAIALREADIREPILLMEGFYHPNEIPLLADHFLIPALHNLHQVELFVAANLENRLPVYLKLNTGMNRLGLNPDELTQARALLSACDHCGTITLMTHFADADEPRGIEAQLAAFLPLLERLGAAGSCANSAALLRFPESCGSADHWVRPGIMLYGGSPFPSLHSAQALDLKPVMHLESELIAVRDLLPGDRVGYGGQFVADQPMRVGVVACGYADGYPRLAPTGTPAAVCGIKTRTLGRISMDKLCVDLSHIPQATLGSRVTLWGDQVPADEVASAAGTVSYELFCALARRVPVVVTEA